MGRHQDRNGAQATPVGPAACQGVATKAAAAAVAQHLEAWKNKGAPFWGGEAGEVFEYLLWNLRC